jgi:outer membrane protein TolC
VKTFVCSLVMCVLASPAASLAAQATVSPPAEKAAAASPEPQPPAVPSSSADEPVLTLENAVSLAYDQNRTVKDAALESEKYEFRVNVAKSRRLPQFQLGVLAGELLHSIDFTFPAGSFGTYPSTGPIPATDSKITTPAQFTTFITGSIDMPLLQQYKIGLGISATKLGGALAREAVRQRRQKVAADVRTAYFDLIATQTAVDAARAGVETLEEARRVTSRHEAEQTVLRADALEVDARLAQVRYDLSVAQHGLASGRERLNELLGRDLTTPFRVLDMPEDDQGGLTLDEARRRAQASRPEIKQAHLRAEQAEFDRRIAKAEYIPDLSLSLRYMGFNNFEVVPANVTSAGVFLSWEPFDWGRRKNNVAEKVKTVVQAKNAAQETESQIAVEVGATFRRWQDTRLLLEAARTGHRAALERFRVTTSRYREQAALLKDLLEAQARSTQTAFQFQQALSSYWSALADLRRAMGED